MEHNIFKGVKKGVKRYWLRNLFRALLVLFTVIVALWLGDKLDKFLSLLGGIACIPITFTLPALFHYKLVAKTDS